MVNRTSIVAILILALVCIGVLGGCQTVASPVLGIYMQNVKYPLDAGTPRVGKKEGKACATSYLGVFAIGDASIKAAAAEGRITKIDSVEADVTNLVVIGTFCTIVRGS